MIMRRIGAKNAEASGCESSTARLSGVVSRIFGGFSRCFRRSVAVVSPLRVAIVMSNDNSQTGRIRLRATSAASAFSGET